MEAESVEIDCVFAGSAATDPAGEQRLEREDRLREGHAGHE
jgi:hypothetical protein